MKKRIRRLINEAIMLAYKAEYALQSRFEYYTHVLRGGSPRTRIIKCHYVKHQAQSEKVSTINRLCLFVAYHKNDDIPASNLKYIESLNSCGFRILYIHNGELTNPAIDSLKPFCERIISRSNIGQDFGAWKDAYIYCQKNQLLSNTEWLLLCNDSNYFLGGDHAKTFTTSFNRELSDSKSDLIALNINYEIWQHYQSYFLCFHSRIFANKKFDQFWKQYIPLNNRFHAIKKGEVALTRNIIGSASASILYDSPKLFYAILEYSPPAEDILQYLPKNSLSSLKNPWENLSQPINKVYLQQVLAYLDSHNPAHAYALLWVKFLKSPFLKKDLYRQGVFTLPQIASMLNNEYIEGGPKFLNQILNNYSAGGSNASYINYPREAYSKGIPLPSVKTFHGYDYKLLDEREVEANSNS